MIRNLLVALLLTTSIAVADKKPGDKKATAPATAKKKTVAMQEQTAEAKANTKAEQVQTEETQPDRMEPQGGSEQPEGPSEALAQTQADKDAKLTSVPGGKALGMSVLGNQEAPTSLVIVPWKTSEVGRSLSVSPLLDDSRQPVDKEVFMRALRYYQIRSETKP